MNGNFIPQYLKLLKRLESIGDISKEAVFKALKIDNKKELEEVIGLTDREFMKRFNLKLNRSGILTQKDDKESLGALK